MIFCGKTARNNNAKSKLFWFFIDVGILCSLEFPVFVVAAPMLCGGDGDDDTSRRVWVACSDDGGGDDDDDDVCVGDNWECVGCTDVCTGTNTPS